MSYSYEDYVAYYKYYYGEQYGTYYAQQAAAAAGVQVGVAAAAPPPPNSQARFFWQFLDHFWVRAQPISGSQICKNKRLSTNTKASDASVVLEVSWNVHFRVLNTPVCVLVFLEELTRLRPEV